MTIFKATTSVLKFNDDMYYFCSWGNGLYTVAP